jgi:pullulanase/glycogen debranching enzyme
MIPPHFRVAEGHPFPLGATWTGLGVNFALFSAHASKVELCLFDDQGEREIERIELPELLTKSGMVSCLMRGLARFMATGCMGLTNRPPAIVSNPISCCSILTPAQS